MMKNVQKILFFLLLMLAIQMQLIAQEPSAVADFSSPNKGILIPRTDTAFVNAVFTPAVGLLIYQNDDATFYYWNGSKWVGLRSDLDTDATDELISNFSLNGDILRITEAGTVRNVNLSSFRDNLGDHVLTQNLQTGGFRISNDGDDEGIFIDSNGNVGIGTTIPSEKLTVSGSLRVFSSAQIASTDIVGGDFITSAGNGVINCGGSINTNANVIGDVTTPNIVHAAGDEDLWIQDDLEVVGAAYKTGGGSWSSISDRRLKRDIHPFEEGLSTLLRINPVRYKYSELFDLQDKDKEFIGIIAQDMLEIAPFMVEEQQLFQKQHEDENGNVVIDEQGDAYYVYDASALTYMLVNAVKEQQKIIDELKDEMNISQVNEMHSLRMENEAIKKEMSELRGLMERFIEEEKL